MSFRNECRQMVIVSLEVGEEHRGTLYGYALEVRCPARAAATQHTPVPADTR